MKTVPPTRRCIQSTICHWVAVVALTAAGCHQEVPPSPRSGGSSGTASADAAPTASAPADAADLAASVDVASADGAPAAKDAGRDLAPLEVSGATDLAGADAPRGNADTSDGAAANDTVPAPTDTGTIPPSDAAIVPSDAAPIVPAPGCGSTLVYSGQETVVDAFPTGAGILIVRASGVLLVDRTGQVLREVKMPREVTGAAYDGTRLVIADGGMLTEFRATLERVGSKPLREPCSVMTILGDGRVVCSGSTYLFTYRMDTTVPGKAINFARPRLRVVPGTSDVIEGGASLARYPDVGFPLGAYGDQDAKLWGPYAFKGNPVTHVVATDGALLKIAGCTLTQPGSPGCFTPRGTSTPCGPRKATSGWSRTAPPRRWRWCARCRSPTRPSTSAPAPPAAWRSGSISMARPSCPRSPTR